MRGSSSGIEVPHFRQENFSEKTSVPADSRAPLAPVRCGFDRPFGRPVRRLAGGRHLLHLHDALRQRHRRLDRVRQPLAHVRLHLQPVHDHRDVVLVLLVELDLVLEPAQLAVDLGARVALGAQLLEQVLVLALAAADHRRQHHEAGALVERHHVVDDLLHRLAGDRRAAAVAVRVPDPRPQQAQVVVDLGHGADRRPRVARGGLLVDRDRRRQPLDRVHVGLVHLAQELAGVGRQRLDVAALALGVDRVEGKARLTGPGEPGDDDQGVARQLEGDVLEVVLARTRDADAVIGGDDSILGGGSTGPGMRQAAPIHSRRIRWGGERLALLRRAGRRHRGGRA